MSQTAQLRDGRDARAPSARRSLTPRLQEQGFELLLGVVSHVEDGDLCMMKDMFGYAATKTRSRPPRP